jgi:hypothetical protein
LVGVAPRVTVCTHALLFAFLSLDKSILWMVVVFEKLVLIRGVCGVDGVDGSFSVEVVELLALTSAADVVGVG